MTCIVGQGGEIPHKNQTLAWCIPSMSEHWYFTLLLSDSSPCSWKPHYKFAVVWSIFRERGCLVVQT